MGHKVEGLATATVLLLAVFVISVSFAGDPPGPAPGGADPAANALGLRTDLVLLLTKGCSQDDLGCTAVPRKQRSPLFAILQRAGTGWSVAQLHPANYGLAEGEKQKQGDRKTPEGLYHTMNAVVRRDRTSEFGGGHILLSYPNSDDEGRKQPNPGAGIYIHGGNGGGTLGCTRVLDEGAGPGHIHERGVQATIEALRGGQGGQAAVVQVPFYPARCLPAPGQPLPGDCSAAIDYVVATAGSLSNEEVIRIASLMKPTPGTSPVAEPARPTPSSAPARQCDPSHEEAAAMADFPVRVVGDVIEVSIGGATFRGTLPPAGTSAPLGFGPASVQVTHHNCDASPDVPECAAPPETVAITSVLVLRTGPNTLVVTAQGRALLRPDGAQIFTPFGGGSAGSDGIIIDTPNGPVVIPTDFGVIEMRPPRAEGGTGWCGPGVPCDANGAAFDDDYGSAWCGQVGDALVLPYSETSLVANLSIFNGAHSADFFDHLSNDRDTQAEAEWRRFGRVSKLRVSGASESSSSPVVDLFGGQTVAAGDAGVCAKELRITIEAVVPGSDGPAGVGCISELTTVFGTPAAD